MGNVIGALTLESDSANVSGDAVTGSKRHIPYRDSKLTRLLQESLAGNSKTVLILAISCLKSSCVESMATLRFGERARRLRTKPNNVHLIGESSSSSRQQTSSAAEVASLQRALSEARSEIYRLSEVIADLSRPSQAAICCSCNQEFGDENAVAVGMSPVALFFMLFICVNIPSTHRLQD